MEKPLGLDENRRLSTFIGSAPPPPGYRFLNAAKEHSLYRYLLALQIYASPWRNSK